MTEEKEEKPKIKYVLRSPPKKRKSELSLFAKTVKRKSALKKSDRLKLVKLRSMLEKKRLQNKIEKLKIKNKLDSLKRKGKSIEIKHVIKSIRQPYFVNEDTNNDLRGAFNADIGHGDKSVWGDESYHDEYDTWDEDFYTEDYYGNIGINWGKLRRKEGNPLFW